jgi:hypothetical protein
MIESIIIITNNALVSENFNKKFTVNYISGTATEVLVKVRDYIHRNHRLLTHPLVSSIKPNEMPFRTVIISKDRDNNIDMESLELIEKSISTTNKFMKDFGIPNWNKNILQDFQLIDFDIINNAIK